MPSPSSHARTAGWALTSGRGPATLGPMVTIETERLLLRPFRGADADEFARLAGAWPVASMTSDIPYPFSARQALGWLEPARGEVRFAIEREGRLMGGVGFYRRSSGVAELGFWLGVPWWGQGYATEASRAVLARGARNPRLPGFSSAHFVDNPASARVLNKLGFEPMGQARIACAARRREVEAVTYWLDRRQVARNMPAAQDESPQPRWRAWLSRLATD